MSTELNLSFASPKKVIVHLRGEQDDASTDALDFDNPITDADLEDIRWYVETYGAHWTSDPDDERARRIEQNLETWGAALYDAVFKNSEKAMYFAMRFRETRQPNRILTIGSGDPTILTLPWELLKPPGGVFLCNENPRISVRRKHGKTGEGRAPLLREAKPALRVLFLVSRPDNASFINPYADPRAVLDGLGTDAPVTVEFLRPATLEALQERLRDQDQPAVDVLHFDGHGVFDQHGGLKDQADRNLPEYVQNLIREAERRGEAITAPDKQGYLLFEDRDGEMDLVSAKTLGELLYQQSLGLVVLSACQSAKMGEEAMGSVSAWLSHAGIPSVLAMTHSVLVATTQKLFGAFYQSLAQGKPIGAALDDARAKLYFDPARGERLRANEPVTLRLYDWFLPALYQSGRDRALLTAGAEKTRAAQDEFVSALPQRQESGFFGRTRELWRIERAFGVQGTQRLSLTGFGGQGKTALALEAARWLLRAGLFQRALFVSFARFQGEDAVGYAISEIGVALRVSLPNADQAFSALQSAPTLLVLDNLESLARTPLVELLDTAARWSAQSDHIRILLTARLPDFGHEKYPIHGSFHHQRLPLDGLAEPDALDWCHALLRLPPGRGKELPPLTRVGLVELLAKVRFHPLSIGLLAKQLQTQGLPDLMPRLGELLAAEPEGEENRELLASLNLSLERLEEKSRRWLPRLGVFENGAMEAVLLRVTGLAQVEEDPAGDKMKALVEALESGDPTKVISLVMKERTGQDLPAEMQQFPPEMLSRFAEQMLPEIIQKFEELFGMSLEQAKAKYSTVAKSELVEGATESTWPELKQGLIATGLVEPENLTSFQNLSGLGGGTYLRFHPSLAPALWTKLDAAQREELEANHRRAYYRLSGTLYHEDRQHPHQARTIARRELPNLLRAVYAALEADAPNAADFAVNVNKFLDNFGLRRDYQTLAERSAQAAADNSDSSQWYLARSNLGEQLFNAGRYTEAKEVFTEVLMELGEVASYERCLTLGRLGNCFKKQGCLDKAINYYHDASKLLEIYNKTYEEKHQLCVLKSELADALSMKGDYPKSKAEYESVLKIMIEKNDIRSIAAINNQLAILAFRQKKLCEAERRYQETLSSSRHLQEPASEASALHGLGMVYQELQQLEIAEQAYRESARIYEIIGYSKNVAIIWNQLALLSMYTGNFSNAEAWYRKTIDAIKDTNDRVNLSLMLTNLADLLIQYFPQRMLEAQQLAEESLAIRKKLSLAVSEIWTTYNVLADIYEHQGERTQASKYRRQSRRSRMEFIGTRYELRQFILLFTAMVGAVYGDIQSKNLAQDIIVMFRENGALPMQQLADGLERILAGERKLSDPDSLEPVYVILLETIMQGIENPEMLQDLLETDPT